MPELPEVETVRRALAARIGEGCLVRGVRVAAGDRWAAGATLRAGSWLLGARRRGKYLLLTVAETPTPAGYDTLLVHLGMSGVLEWLPGPAGDPGRHERLAVDLAHPEGGLAHLRLVDPRGFGGVWRWHHRDPAPPRLAKLGPEPLEPPLSPAALAARLRGRRPVKAALLDQATVAGIGNIYADEALWAAGIHPATGCAKLTEDRTAALAGAVVAALRAGLADGGTTLRDYRNLDGGGGAHQQRLAVYGRHGHPCLRCAAPLARSTVAGRGTTSCPRCQPRPAA